MKRNRRGLWLPPLCALLSLLLAVMPLPELVEWSRPSFPLWVVVYWSIVQPERYGTWSGFGLGLFVDVLLAVPLGTHALAFAVVAWAASRLSARMKVLPALQQMLAVMLVAGVALVLIRLAGKLTGVPSAPLGISLLPVLATALFWPWAWRLQDRLRRLAGLH